MDGHMVKMYTCGPTVYRYAHIGNMRSFLLGDLVRRALRFEGQAVLWAMNITDVGHMTDDMTLDKMDLAAQDEGLAPLEIAEKYTKAFLEDAAAVGIEPADIYPRATDHIQEMIALIEKLVERGHAYETRGSVYYDVLSFPAYGKLSGNTLEALRAGHRQGLELDPNKRHHADFALWKRAAANRLMKWPSPWGDGFPGWHVECSAMSMKYLGERFDVHTGGNDLKFPHHEDEIAQSEGATGHEVVSVWVHGGFLQLAGQKIAKSADNTVRASEITDRGLDPLAFRLLCFGARYRSEMDFSWEALEGAHARLAHIRQRMADWSAEASPERLSGEGMDLDRRFREALADDLDMPAALVVLNETLAANHLSNGERRSLVAPWDAVLGLDVQRLTFREFRPGKEAEELIRRRDEARRARDFPAADRLRDQLAAMGLEVMDTPEGTTVRPLT